MKSASTFVEPVFRLGGEFDRSLPNTVAADYANSVLILDTQKETGDASIAYAMYRFNAAGVKGMPSLATGGVVQQTGSGLSSNVYLGLANYERGAWEWYSWPGTNKLELDSLEPYTSPSGEVIVAVVCQSAKLTFEWLRLGEPSWQSEQLELGQAFRDWVIARSGHDGRIRFCITLESEGPCIVAQSDDGWDVEPINLAQGSAPMIARLGWVPFEFQLDANDTPYVGGVDGADWGLEEVIIAYRTELGYIEFGGPPGYLDNSPVGPYYSGNRFCLSLAFDSTNQLHIAYFTGDSAQLGYAVRNADGSWTDMIVDSTGPSGEACALTLDANGFPSITYNANSHGEQRFAYSTGGPWQRQTVERSYSGNIYGAGIALLSSGDPVLTYTNSGMLYYCVKDVESGFVDKYEFGFARAQGGCQLIQQANGTPALLADGPQDNLFKVAQFKNLDWQERWLQLPEGQAFSLYPHQRGFVVDVQGNPHVIYVDKNSMNVYHAFLR